MTWTSAAIIGLMIAALHYGRSVTGSRAGSADASPRGARGWPGANAILIAAILRAIAATVVAAMLLGAPSGRARPLPPLVALDASASWTRGDRALSAWASAAAAARRLANGDSLLLFGDSLRAVTAPPARPDDRRSAVGPAIEAARESHRRLVIISDGEFGDEAPLPPGTRLTIFAHPNAVDVGAVALVAPSRAAPGDTIQLRLTVRAGNKPVADAVVSAGFAGSAAAVAHSGPLGALAEREVVVPVVAPRGEREELLRASVTAAGDVEPRNDTLTTVVEITRVPAAVLISSSPDPDARTALEALTGALVARPRGYYEVAPGAWRDATTLRAVSAADVRAAATSAPLLVIHGDTTVLGAPARIARASVVLMVPGDAGDVEWRAAAGGDSPLSASLAGIVWDSIPPIELPSAAPHGEWTALEAKGAGVAPRAVVVGGESEGRRRLVVAASGLWRWRARGGAARDAYDALWGAIADWSTSVAVDVRPALPARRWLREGEPVPWLRTGADSLVELSLRATRGAEGGAADSAARSSAQSFTLRFAGDARTAATPPLPAGRYTATMRGGSASFVVNASDELLPARASSHAVARGAAPGGIPAPPLGERWWGYVLALAAVCGEWIIRRRAGLR